LAEKGKQSLIDFAEVTFGRDDVKTKYLKDISPLVERVVSFRNAVEHPGGYFENQKFSRGAEWESFRTGLVDRQGRENTPESSIRAVCVALLRTC
jgi:hypothetical protein